ncbi:glycerol-3-phosphate 1-O-acyltransferase PlsY [Altericista sp. CCNU0014]|uniref:glycerol-3-phosphate 1-O-acyltransferase PlsY n=1 Tax=Altericista sp. CCNU0014 TaxID=3082949 RepID=UPI00384B5E51
MPLIALWSLGNAALLIAAYLLGSIPTGYILGRWLKGIDIRDHGSGSTGATNVLRVVGKGPGATVLAVDMLKGAAAIALTQLVYQPSSSFLTWAPSTVDPTQWFPWIAVLAGLAAVLGHSKSVWLKFSGGKSVATGLGLLLALNWQVGLSAFGIFAVVLALSRTVSLSSILSVSSVPLLMVALHQPLAYVLLGLVGGSYVVIRHRSNIQRLWAGTEPRLGQQRADRDLNPDV